MNWKLREKQDLDKSLRNFTKSGNLKIAVPQRLKPHSKQGGYRSGEPLRHPKSSAQAVNRYPPKIKCNVEFVRSL
ncbi:MAG: hypothetical protein ABSG07_04370 [Terriglobales bacterium]|jgi:hypothetical protein